MVVELRCPTGHHRLLGKVTDSAADPGGPLIELACNDCARALRRDGINARRVLHCYTTAGLLADTRIVHGG